MYIEPNLTPIPDSIDPKDPFNPKFSIMHNHNNYNYKIK